MTINRYLEKLEPAELENIQSNLVYRMIRRKSFNDAKFLGRWLIFVDRTKLDEGFTKKNQNYLECTYHRGTDGKFTFCDIMSTSFLIVLIILSLATPVTTLL